MESGRYAVLTLLFAVLQIAENSCSSRKRLKMLEVRRNYPSFAASNSKTYAVNYAVLVGVINNFVRNSQIGFVQENGWIASLPAEDFIVTDRMLSSFPCIQISQVRLEQARAMVSDECGDGFIDECRLIVENKCASIRNGHQSDLRILRKRIPRVLKGHFEKCICRIGQEL